MKNSNESPTRKRSYAELERQVKESNKCLRIMTQHQKLLENQNEKKNQDMKNMSRELRQLRRETDQSTEQKLIKKLREEINRLKEENKNLLRIVGDTAASAAVETALLSKCECGAVKRNLNSPSNSDEGGSPSPSNGEITPSTSLETAPPPAVNFDARKSVPLTAIDAIDVGGVSGATESARPLNDAVEDDQEMKFFSEKQVQEMMKKLELNTAMLLERIRLLEADNGILRARHTQLIDKVGYYKKLEFARKMAGLGFGAIESPSPSTSAQ